MMIKLLVVLNENYFGKCFLMKGLFWYDIALVSFITEMWNKINLAPSLAVLKRVQHYIRPDVSVT